MKIAIVGPGFTGATFPLAQHLNQMGHKIDCYYLTHIGLSSVESLDFEGPLRGAPLIQEIPKTNSLYRYLNNNINIYIIPIHRRHLKLEKLIIGLPLKLSNYLRKNAFVKKLHAEKYDRIILIDQFDNEQIGKALAKLGEKFVTSYHEVLTKLLGAPVLRERVRHSLQLGRPAILHCNKLRDDVVNLSGIENIEKRLSVIRVGPFESLWQYGEGKAVEGVMDGYLLFMGRIIPYKGVGILYKAVESLRPKYDNNVVIAGNGDDPVLKEMINNKSYHIINRYISNAEMVWLVKHCRAIVCPYIAASQSGLMPLAFAYNKPIIATKVGAFPEVIEDGVNGFLSESITDESFADAIKRCIDTERTFTGKPLPESINWDYIAKQVLKVLE